MKGNLNIKALRQPIQYHTASSTISLQGGRGTFSKQQLFICSWVLALLPLHWPVLWDLDYLPSLHSLVREGEKNFKQTVLKSKSSKVGRENTRESSQALSIVPAAPRVYLLKWPRLTAPLRNSQALWPAEELVQHTEPSQITARLTTGHFEQADTVK